MDSTQGRLRAVHLTTILVVGGLVAMVTSSCGSDPQPDAPVEGQDAAVVEQPDTSVTPDAEQPDTGHFIDAGPCVPQPIDCTGKCGPVRDACSGEVKLCGGCPTGEVCDLQLHTCGVPKKQCSDFGAECGRVKTSCGQYITCGSCPSGKECNPDTNKCVSAQTVACPDLGYECGLAWLGAGDPTAKTNCGTCQDPNKSRCNNTFNVCEPSCTAPWKVAGLTGPQVVAAKKAFCDGARQNKGVECGIISDGCGGIIDCTLSQGFSCPAGQGCGVRGVANRCEPFPTPPECETLGKNCGTIVSACDGKTLSCGVCGVTGEVCNDNGVCGPPCKSKTCAEALPSGQACGNPSDGCKGTLNCTCPGSGKCVTGGTCCQPKTCAQLNVTAGSCGKQLDNGCGGKIDCPCATGQCPAGNGAIATCCTPRTCNGFYAGQCGNQLDDGCGATINCGCGGGSCIVGGPPGSPAPNGTPGKCCAETNCAGGSCNTSVSSVCITGQSITCNTCTGPQVCTGTSCCTPGSSNCNNQCGVTLDPGCGLPTINCGCTGINFNCVGNQCVCDAYKCDDAAHAGKCGSFDNNCGGTLNCGCPTVGDVCNPNTQACCTPRTCGGFYAGKCGNNLDDGCGHFNLDCGCGGDACIVGGPPGTPAPSGTTGTCCADTKCAAGSCNTSFPSVCISGQTINCNTCNGSQICNGTSCCQPGSSSCGNQCNVVLNPGCGLPTVSCSCTAPFTCGAGNTCGCKKKTCAADYPNQCGAASYSDGCGGNIAGGCGCTSPNSCGGGGVAGQCGCTKKTVADCVTAGPLADGCGGFIVCPA